MSERELFPSGRYFGFVIGGALPAAVAANRLTSTWDQNERRARGFAIYAAIHSLGRAGIAEMIGRCCDDARRFAAALEAGGATVLAAAVLEAAAVHV